MFFKAIYEMYGIMKISSSSSFDSIGTENESWLFLNIMYPPLTEIQKIRGGFL